MNDPHFLDVSEPIQAVLQFLSSRGLSIVREFSSWPDLIHHIVFPEIQDTDLHIIQETYEKWRKYGYARCLRELLFTNDQIGLCVFNGCPPFHSIIVSRRLRHPENCHIVLHMPNNTLFLLISQFQHPCLNNTPNMYNNNSGFLREEHFFSTNIQDAMPFDGDKDVGMEEVLVELHRLYSNVPSFDDGLQAYEEHERWQYKCSPINVLRQKMTQAPDKFKMCRLHLEGCNMGYAYPLHYGDRSKHSRITLIGRINCGRAASGDTVCVELFDRPNPESEFYGCVIGVLEPTLKRTSSLAPCAYNAFSAKPLFPGVPQIHFPRMDAAQVRKQYDRECGSQARTIINNRRHSGMLTPQDRNLASSDEALKRCISLYKPIRQGDSIGFDNFPPRVVRLDMIENKYFVLVHEEMWNPSFKYPIGRAVARLVYPITVSDTIPLLRLYYQMPLTSTYEMGPQIATNRFKAIENVYKRVGDKQRINWIQRGRTIILDDANTDCDPNRDCDQAISVLTLTEERCFEVAFHVSDVAEVIQPDSDLDNQARRILCSSRGKGDPQSGCRYLFPDLLTERALSFTPKEKRFALSAVFYFSYDGELLDSPPPNVTIPGASATALASGMLSTLIQPQIQMSASQMAQCLRNRDDTSDCELVLMLQNLCKFTKFLRQRRLRSRGAFSLPVHCKTDFLSPPMDIEFRFIREEFVWLVNQRMLRMLESTPLKSLIPVHVMQCPPQEDVNTFLNHFKEHIQSSPILQQHLTSITGPEFLDELRTNPRNTSDRYRTKLSVPWQLMNKLRQILQFGSMDRQSSVARLLAVEELLPSVQLVMHHLNRLKSIRQWTLLQSALQLNTGHAAAPLIEPDACEPLKNYLHLFVQRCIKLVMRVHPNNLNISSAPLRERDLWPLVRECSHIDNRFNTFHQACQRTFLARQCFHEPVVIQATVVECNRQEIILNHPFLEVVTAEEQFCGNEGQHLSADDLRIQDSDLTIGQRNGRNHLRIISSGGDEANESVEFSWIARVYSLLERNTGRKNDSLLQLNMNHTISKASVPFSMQSGFERGDHLFSQEGSDQRHLTEMISSFFNGIDRTRAPPDPSIVNDVLAEYDISDREQWLIQMTKSPVVRFRIKFSPGDTLMLQYGCSQSTPSHSEILSTRLHYVSLTPSYGLCVEHKRFPEKCFLASRLKRIPPSFQGIDDYVGCHLLVNRHENLHQAVTEMICNRLVDVPVHWFYYNSPNQQQNNGSEEKRPLIGVFFMKNSFIKERFLPFQSHRGNVSGNLKDVLEKACSSLHTIFYVCVTTTTVNPEEATSEEQISAPKWIAHGFLNGISLVKLESKSFHKYLLRSKIIIQEEIDAMKEGSASEECVLACSFVVTSSLSQVNLSHLKNNCSIEFIRNPPSSMKVEATFSKLLHLHEEHVARQLALGLNPHRMNNPTFDEMETCEELMYSLETHLRPAGFQLNNNQRHAVESALKNRVSLIFGPPGTGKSTVISCLALAYFLRNRALQRPKTDEDEKKRALLVVAPSNTAVDVVAEAILKLFVKVFGPSSKARVPYTILRLYGRSLEMEDYPVPGLRWNYYNAADRGVVVPESLKSIAVHHMARQMDPSLVTEFNDIKVPRDAYAYQKHLQNVYETLIGTVDILCCTTVTCSQDWLCKKLDFVQIVMDEAGMCKEGESFIPLLNAPNTENVVLVGDHKQLAPILMSPSSASLGLNVSLFERYSRLWENNQNVLCRLNTQYRMHPSICEFPSSYTYNNTLFTAPNRKWTSLSNEDIQEIYFPFWTGLNSAFVIKPTIRIPTELIPEEVWPALRPPDEPYNLRLNTGHAFPSDIPQYPPEGVREHIVFIHIENGNEITNTHNAREMGAKSKANLMEVEEAFRIFSRLADRAKQLKAIPSAVILSQYRYQVHLINEKIQRSRHQNIMNTGAKAISVNSSQGSEWDYVIFSTVRTQPSYNLEQNPSLGWQRKHLGFITDQNQVNVAITRARKGLIIIGNANLLKLNETWRLLLTNLNNRGCYVNGSNNFWIT